MVPIRHSRRNMIGRQRPRHHTRLRQGALYSIPCPALTYDRKQTKGRYIYMSIFTDNDNTGNTSENIPGEFLDQIGKATAKDSSWFSELHNKAFEQMQADEAKSKQEELEKRLSETEKQFEEEYRQAHQAGNWDQGAFAETVAPLTESMQRDGTDMEKIIKNIYV